MAILRESDRNLRADSDWLGWREREREKQRERVEGGHIIIEIPNNNANEMAIITILIKIRKI